MYVIPGDVTVNYASGQIRRDKKKWRQCSRRGSRGEFTCHMAEKRKERERQAQKCNVRHGDFPLGGDLS